MISDEGGYAQVTRRWLDDGGRLYHDLWISRPQGIFFAYAAIMETLGTSVVAIRLGAALVAALTLVFVWLFARAWAGERVATVAAFLFAVLAASPTIEGYTANAEVFMALPVAAGAWLLLRAIGLPEGRARRWHLGAVGGCAALALLLKPSGLVLLPMAVAFLWLRAPAGPRASAARLWPVLAGFAAILAPALIHGWYLGWHEYIFAAVTYRLSYQSTTTASFAHQMEALRELLRRAETELWVVGIALAVRYRVRLAEVLNPKGARTRSRQRLSDSTVVGLVTPPTVLAMGAETRFAGRNEAGSLLLGLWLLGAVAGVAVGGDWWFHYLIQIAAPLALWLAALLVGAWPELGKWWRRGLAVIVIAGLLGPYWVIGYRDVNRMSLAILDQPGYPAQVAVSRYVREHAPREATIFVAFDQPAIYYLADRPAAYRYLYDQELQGIPGSYDDLIAVVSADDRPYYVIGTRERAPYPDKGIAFWNAVSDHYVLETMVHGVPIYRAAEFPKPPRLR